MIDLLLIYFFWGFIWKAILVILALRVISEVFWNKNYVNSSVQTASQSSIIPDPDDSEDDDDYDPFSDDDEETEEDEVDIESLI